MKKLIYLTSFIPALLLVTFIQNKPPRPVLPPVRVDEEGLASTLQSLAFTPEPVKKDGRAIRLAKINTTLVPPTPPPTPISLSSGASAFITSPLPHLHRLPALYQTAGWTLLHAAAEEGNRDTINLLLQTPTHPCLFTYLKTQDLSKNTALHLASRKGYDIIIRLLLLACPDRAAATECAMLQDSAGMNALHWAAVSGSSAAVLTILLHTDIDLGGTNEAGLTAKEIAEEQLSFESDKKEYVLIKDILQAYEAFLGHRWCEETREELTKIFISLSALAYQDHATEDLPLHELPSEYLPLADEDSNPSILHNLAFDHACHNTTLLPAEKSPSIV